MSTQFSTEAAMLRAEMSATPHQGDSRHPQRRSNPVNNAPRSPV